MKYSWVKEPNLGITKSKSPHSGEPLSGVVIIIDSVVTTSYIKITKDTVSRIGSKMPYGIGPDNIAYLKIIKKSGYYDVFCCYIDLSRTVPLWKSNTLPTWITTKPSL